MKHTHKEKFNWIIYKSHKRPPRLHVRCSLCGECFQAVPNINGKIETVFRTGRKPTLKLKPRSVRLSDEGYKELREMIKVGKIR